VGHYAFYNQKDKEEEKDMKTLLNKIQAFIREEEGAAALEYAFLVAGIALAAAAGIMVLGSAINTKFNAVATNDLIK
jgi:Flp pilus assembly pilin Flp